MMKIKTKPLLIILCIMASIVLLANLVDVRFEYFVSDHNENIHMELPWDSEMNLIQKGNTCGAHSSMAVLYVVKSSKFDPYEIYESIPEKLGRGYVYPWGITRYLEKQGIEATTSCLGILNSENKGMWLREKINSGKPVIVIVGNSKYLHYVTLLGYTENNFMIYDSLLEKDLNFELAGNITVPSSELIKRMATAKYYGIPLNVAIEIELKKPTTAISR